jgi:outer membrane protein
MTNMTFFARRAKAVAGIAVAAAFISLAANAAIAQGQPKPAAPAGVPEPKILVIDRGMVMRASKVGQDIGHQVQGYTQSAESELKGEADSLRKEEASLQQQVAILAPDVRNQKINAFKAKQTAFQQKVQQRQQQIQYGVFLARQQLDKALGPIIQGIMQERGANLLLDRNAVVYGTNAAFDITPVAIQRLDQKLPSVKVQLVSPPPGMTQQQQGQSGRARALPGARSRGSLRIDGRSQILRQSRPFHARRYLRAHRRESCRRCRSFREDIRCRDT